MAEPTLPPGQRVELPGRGSTFVRDLAGPPGAPVVVLLHGWTATADLNWFPSFAPLGRRFRVVALDHRGHGRGIRSRQQFRLEACADDVVALADVLGIDRFVVAGYSMGGPIAQLTWQQHPRRVSGLVLCATAAAFTTGRPEERLRYLSLGSMAMASRMGPEMARRWMSEQLLSWRTREYEPWAEAQVRQHDWTTVLEAGREIGRFSSLPWIGTVDVPTAVVTTTKDTVVPLRRQLRLAEAIPGARVFTVATDHDGCVTRPELFVPELVSAATWVAERARSGTPPRRASA